MSTDKLYVVIKRGLFWRPEDKGYTAKIEEAGRYTKGEALSRCHGREQPVTMALASSFQTQESLQAEVDALRLALTASRDEAEKAKAKLHAIDLAVDGYVDGAPDCNAVSKLANQVSLIVNPPEFP